MSIVFIFSTIIINFNSQSFMLWDFIESDEHWKCSFFYIFENKCSSKKLFAHVIYENVLLLGGIHYFPEQEREKARIYKPGFQYVIFKFPFFHPLTPCFLVVSNWIPASIDAESLCNRLTEKLNLPHGHRLVLAHMPLLLVCLEVCKQERVQI